MMGNLKENILQEMQLRNWKTPQLAEASGVSQSIINRYLNGKHKDITDVNVIKLAKGFGITEQELRFKTTVMDYIDSTAERIDDVKSLQSSNLKITKNLIKHTIAWLPLYSLTRFDKVFDSNNVEKQGDEFMPVNKSDYDFDLNNCFGIKLENDNYASVYKKGSDLAVTPDLTPEDGHTVLVQFASDGHTTLAIYQSPTRFQLISKTNTESKEYPPGEVKIIGVVFCQLETTNTLINR